MSEFSNPFGIKNGFKHEDTLTTTRSNDLHLITLVLIYCMMKKSFECSVKGGIKITKFSHNVEKQYCMRRICGKTNASSQDGQFINHECFKLSIIFMVQSVCPYIFSVWIYTTNMFGAKNYIPTNWVM